MASQALYNKWRGQTFQDILGQEHITTTLRNQIKAGRVGHAYLFTGVRGTGKTSTARIMAKAVNCTGDTDEPPCNQCHVCQSITNGSALDLIEIDGASNRGIDEIRALREKVHFSPNECRYKVYVIDEVHMLTNEAFNALLKTLEEPPSHVIFILCTTEPHRLPDTVLSRCQRFDFRRGSVQVLASKLQRICSREGIVAEPEALDFVARRAGGSFRDAESLLDQLASYGGQTISLDEVRSVLGAVSVTLVAELARALVEGDLAVGLAVVNQAIDQGAEPRVFLGEILDYLRALMLLRVGNQDGLVAFADDARAEIQEIQELPSFSLGMMVRAIKLFNAASAGLRAAVRPQLPLEVAFVEAALARAEERNESELIHTNSTGKDPSQAAARESRSPVRSQSVAAPTVAPLEATASKSPEPSKATVSAKANLPELPEEAPLSEPKASAGHMVIAERSPEPEPAAPQPVVETEANTRKLTLDWVRGSWRQIVMKIRPLSPQVQALVNSAEPVQVNGQTITLGCVNRLVCDKLLDERKRTMVEEVMSQVLGVPCTLQCVVATPGQAQELVAAPSRPGSLFDPVEQRDAARDRLRNHPAVKEAERLGGQVSEINVYRDTQEDERGEQG